MGRSGSTRGWAKYDPLVMCDQHSSRRFWCDISGSAYASRGHCFSDGHASVKRIARSYGRDRYRVRIINVGGQ
jgi:hypothetical protein